MKALIWIIIAVVVLGGVYLYRNQILALFAGSTPAPVTYTAPSTTASPTTGAIITWQNGAKGQYAVGPTGMTLYKFDKDTIGVSNCTGGCLQIWPPYIASSTPPTLPANVTIITRNDGSMQFAYKGLPLYYYSGDSIPGDIKGDGFNGIWHLVTP